MPELVAGHIKEVLVARGPLTGSDLVRYLRGDLLSTWRACASDPGITLKASSSRYLRLDSTIDGWARLSPSIGREFLNYTIVHLSGHEAEAEAKLAQLRAKTESISLEKRGTAANEMSRVASGLNLSAPVSSIVFLLGGDIAYRMAHDSPRGEVSTGRLVHGSDIDIVVIHDEAVPAVVIAQLDAAMLRAKWRLLSSPSHGEELDYVVKSLGTAAMQTTSNLFRDSIAAKILYESEFLLGDQRLYDQVKDLVRESAVPERVGELTARAQVAREAAEQRLSQTDSPDEADLRLFISREESEEL